MRQSVAYPKLLPLSEVRLGRFVINVDEPWTHYHDPLVSLEEGSVSRSQLSDYELSTGKELETSIWATLTRLFSTSYSQKEKTRVEVSASQKKSCFLRQQQEWFKKSVLNQNTQAWLQDTEDAEDNVFLIVGFRTMLDPKMTEVADTNHNAGLNVELPIGEVLIGAGVPPGVAEQANAGANIEIKRGHAFEERYIAQGEWVCAIEYRRVRVHGFFSRHRGQRYLDETLHWSKKSVALNRAAYEEVADMMGAMLVDDLELKKSCKHIWEGEEPIKIFWDDD